MGISYIRVPGILQTHVSKARHGAPSFVASQDLGHPPTAEIEADGGSVVATEVTIENSAGRARVDLVYKDANGELQFGEAKNGPTAKLNANQTKVYERMKSEGAKLVGGNASKAGLTSNVGATAVRLFKY